jgi:predicted RNase H-like nuclease
MQKQLFLELAYKVRSKLLRQMDALEKILQDLHNTLKDLTPDVKFNAMSIESWINYKEVEKSITQKAVEHDLFLEEVTILERRYGIKMSESY